MKINNLNKFLLQRVCPNDRNILYKDNYIVDRTRFRRGLSGRRENANDSVVDLEWVKSLYFKIVYILSTFCIIS